MRAWDNVSKKPAADDDNDATSTTPAAWSLIDLTEIDYDGDKKNRSPLSKKPAAESTVPKKSVVIDLTESD